MTGRAKKAAAPKKKANGYKMPAPIPSGEVIHDTIAKKKWRIGPSIGVGGFGEIYSACEHDNSPKKGSSYPYVVKIEPHENGPLFVEKHFYIRNANREDVTTFMKSKKLLSLGMPLYFGNGSHNFKGEKYRYLVLERYGKDVWSLFKDAGRSFSAGTVFQLGLQMLDVLEYIHSRGYVHADIKGANILMGMKKGTENQAYLVDFGLATRVNEKDFKPDPKCAHNGTIEYTSRDAHLGVATMRGDLEILGYNMLQWLVGELPWEKALKQPKTVQTSKEDFMKNVRSRITKDYPTVPDALIKFFEYINSMKPKDQPDYTKCQQLFLNFLKSEGKTRSSKIDFTPNKQTTTKRVVVVDDDDTDTRQNGDAPKVKRGRKLKATVPKKKDDSVKDSEDERPNKKGNSAAPKVGRGRKPKEIVPESDDENERDREDERPTKKENGVASKVARSRKVKAIVPESDDENERDSEDEDERPAKKGNGVAPKVARGKKAKAIVPESDDENEEPSEDENGAPPKVKRARKPKTIVPDSDEENDSESDDDRPLQNNKRKSSEPPALERVKKTKLTKVTPPAKMNHANTGTQTSPGNRRSPRAPRQVSFESPIGGSHDTSADMFDESFFVEPKKVKPKKKLLATEELTVKREVRKKTTSLAKKGKSWKDCPTIMHGRSPPE